MTNAPWRRPLTLLMALSTRLISLYVEQGSDTFHTVHAELAAGIGSPTRRGGQGFTAVCAAYRRDRRRRSLAFALYSQPRRRRSGRADRISWRDHRPTGGHVLLQMMLFLRRFSRLLRSLPAYPVFGDGRTRLQPVYADDRCGGDRTNPTAEPKTISYLRTGRSARVLLRGACCELSLVSQDCGRC